MALSFRRLVPVVALAVGIFTFVVTQVFAISYTYGETITWGGTHHETVNDFVRDSSGNLYVIGAFRSTGGDFDPGEGTNSHSTAGVEDIYVSKFSSTNVHQWTKTWGTSLQESANGIAVDAENNALYIVGAFAGSMDVDPGGGTVNRSSATADYNDALLVKLDLTGTYVWDVVIGGTQNEAYSDVAVDAAGNVYVSGWTDSASVDLNPGAGTDTLTAVGSQETFFSKFSNDGTYQWSKKITGEGYKSYEHIEIVNDAIYLGGYLMNTSNAVDFNPDSEETDLQQITGNPSVVLSRYETDGTYNWTRTINADDGFIYQYALATDLDESVYVGGTYIATSVDFDATEGTDTHTGSGDGNAYLTKYNADGSYGWARSLDVGMDEDRVEAIDVTSEGAVFAVGFVGGYDTYDFDGTAGTDSRELEADAVFLTQYSTTGEYGDTILFGEDNYSFHIPGLIANASTVWIAGDFDGTANFDGTGGEDSISALSFRTDAFITRYGYSAATLPEDPPGEGGDPEPSPSPSPSPEPNHGNPLLPQYEWTKAWGGENNDYAGEVNIDHQGNYYVYGLYTSPEIDLNPGPGVDLHTAIPESNASAAIVKFSSDGSYLWGETLFGVNALDTTMVVSDDEGAIYLAGYFKGSDVDFDPGPGTDSHTSGQNGVRYSGYVMKLTSSGEFEWVKVYSAGGDVRIYALDIDSEGNLAVGILSFAPSLDADPSEGTDTKSTNNAGSVIVKLSSEGEYIWGSLVSSTTNIPDVKVGSQDDVFVFGETPNSLVEIEGTDETLSNPSGNRAVFVIKFDKNGNYVWGRIVTSEDYIYGIIATVDNQDNVYIGGDFYAVTDFDTTKEGGIVDTADDNGDGYVGKYDSEGNFQYGISTNIPEIYEDVSIITVDGGYLYYGGYVESGTHDFDPGPGTNIIEVIDGATYLSMAHAETGEYIGTILLINADYSSYANSADSRDGKLVTTGYFSSEDAVFGGEESDIPNNGETDFFLSMYTLSRKPDTDTDTETDTESSPRSSRNRFASKSPYCSAVAPAAPDLFQIDTYSTTATLYFVPREHMDHYWVVYGMGEVSDQYGTKAWLSTSGGAVKMEIHDLLPGMEYSFQILPVNGCMPGDWSNTLKVKTAANPTVKAKSFYAH